VPREENRGRSRPWRRLTSPDLAAQLYGGDHAPSRRSRLATFGGDGKSAWALRREDGAVGPKEKPTNSSIPVADSVASHIDGKFNNINGFSRRAGETSPSSQRGWQRRSTSSPPSRSGISGVGGSLGLGASSVTDSQRKRWAAIAARNVQLRQQQQKGRGESEDQDQLQDSKIQRAANNDVESNAHEPATTRNASRYLGRGNFGGNFNDSASSHHNGFGSTSSSRTTNALPWSKDGTDRNLMSSSQSRGRRSMLPPSDLAQELYGGTGQGRARSASPDLADLRRIAASVRSMPSPEKRKQSGSSSRYHKVNTTSNNEGGSIKKKLDVRSSDVDDNDEESALRAAVKGMQAALSETSLVDSDGNNDVEVSTSARRRASRVRADVGAVEDGGSDVGGVESSISRYVASRSLSPSRDSTLAELRRLAASVRELRPPLSPRASSSSMAEVSPSKVSKSKAPSEEGDVTAVRTPEKMRSNHRESKMVPSSQAPAIAPATKAYVLSKPRSSDTPPGTPPLSGSLDYSLSTDQDWPPAESLLGGHISGRSGAAHNSNVVGEGEAGVGRKSVERGNNKPGSSGRGDVGVGAGGNGGGSSDEPDRSGREYEDEFTDENSLGASTIAALDPDRLQEAQRVKELIS